MPAEPLPQEFHLNIKSVRLTSFKSNPLLDAPTPPLIKINLQHMIRYALPDLVTLTLTISFSTPSDDLFLEGTTQNIFTIQELPLIVDAEKPDLINIPNNILATLLSISISHTRALISQSTLGSKFQDILIPIVNPSDMVAHMSPIEAPAP